MKIITRRIAATQVQSLTRRTAARRTGFNVTSRQNLLSREHRASGSPLMRQWSETLRVCRAARLYYSGRAQWPDSLSGALARPESGEIVLRSQRDGFAIRFRPREHHAAKCAGQPIRVYLSGFCRLAKVRPVNALAAVLPDLFQRAQLELRRQQFFRGDLRHAQDRQRRGQAAHLAWLAHAATPFLSASPTVAPFNGSSPFRALQDFRAFFSFQCLLTKSVAFESHCTS